MWLKQHRSLFPSAVIALIVHTGGVSSGLGAIQTLSSLHLGFSVILRALFSSTWSKLDLCHICISAVYIGMKSVERICPIP